jgi:RNA polymerase sigma-70 factor (ECF subfamily)
MDPKQERALLRRARSDPDAFRALYDHYFPKVYAYVSYRIGRAQDAEDIVADAFLTVVDKLDTFRWRGEGSFAAWLFRIVRNRVSDFYRRGRGSEEAIPLEGLPNLASRALLPADAFARRERFAHLRRLIDALSPRRREVILLRFFAGLRNKEIADLLALDERTVASHLCRGLRDLHHQYVDEEKKGVPDEQRV